MCADVDAAEVDQVIGKFPTKYLKWSALRTLTSATLESFGIHEPERGQIMEAVEKLQRAAKVAARFPRLPGPLG